MTRKRQNRYTRIRQGGLLSTIPFLMAIPPVIGLLIGRYLDDRFDTNPVFTIIFLVFGFAASVREVTNVVRRASEQDDSDGNEHGE